MPAAASRAAPPLGTDTLRNRIESMRRAKKDAAEAVGEAAGVCRHNESQRWLDMRVGSPEDCCRATLPSCRSLRRALQPRRVRVRLPSLLAWLRTAPQSTPSSISTKYKSKRDLLQVVNAPGGSGKTLALATLLAEQEEIRSRSATWQQVEGLGSCDPPE